MCSSNRQKQKATNKELHDWAEQTSLPEAYMKEILACHICVSNSRQTTTSQLEEKRENTPMRVWKKESSEMALRGAGTERYHRNPGTLMP